MNSESLKVALIGDVHANLPALEAVLAHAAKQRVEAVWNVGDFVGYGAFPDEVVTRLRQARHYRVAYDVERAAAAIRERGLPEAFAQVILQGRNLDEVKPGEEPMPENHPPSKESEDSRLEAVMQLARECHYAADHTHQVTRLALQLFDELQSLHGLGAEERLWLQYAALLHDIGWIEGQQAHHKTALRVILTTPSLPFDTRERYIIGSIARYHRKALPDEKHDHFSALEPADRQTVRVLAGLLRVADGLDRTHQSVVENIACEVTPERLVLRCAAKGQPAEEERQEALDKGVLLEQVFERKLVIT